MHAFEGCYCKNRAYRRAIAIIIAGWGLVFLSYRQVAYAWSPWDLIGPSVDEVGFSYSWRHATKADRPTLFEPWHPIRVIIQTTLKNNSHYYLNYVEFECDFYDANKNRLSKNEKFTSAFREEKGDIAPGNSSVWTFVSFNENLSTASGAECKLTRARGNK